MLGVRSDSDKFNSRAQTPFEGLTRKIPLTLDVCMRANAPITLTLSDGARSVTVCGDIPQTAINAPLSEESVKRSLTKLGGTVYTVKEFHAEIEGSLMLPVSRLNDLRRRALQALEENGTEIRAYESYPYAPNTPKGTRTARRTARFTDPKQITPAAKAYFNRLYLPLHRYDPVATGVVLPPVIFDGDTPKVETMLQQATAQGATHALVGNYGHLELVRHAGLIPVGDFRLNATNRESVALAEAHGIAELILSPELTLPQIRDVGGDTEVIVYGRIPLMTLEKCVTRELASCEQCTNGSVFLRDRRGVEFPVLREWEHRNVIYNSLPTGMSDRAEALLQANIKATHFLFSTESPAEVDAIIEAYRKKEALHGKIRRI